MTTPRVSPQKEIKCACPSWTDAVDCIDLRTVGYAPGPNSERDRAWRDECQCCCHDRRDDEDDDD